jgi:hypothetical protein
MPEISGYELARRAANRKIPTLLSSGHPDYTKLKRCDCPYLAKPYRVAELIGEAAEAIAHADKNIRRIKASLVRLAATIEGLKAAMAESEWLMNESKALLAGRPSLEPVIPSDAIDDWLTRLSIRPKPG